MPSFCGSEGAKFVNSDGSAVTACGQLYLWVPILSIPVGLLIFDINMPQDCDAVDRWAKPKLELAIRVIDLASLKIHFVIKGDPTGNHDDCNLLVSVRNTDSIRGPQRSG